MFFLHWIVLSSCDMQLRSLEAIPFKLHVQACASSSILLHSLCRRQWVTWAGRTLQLLLQRYSSNPRVVTTCRGLSKCPYNARYAYHALCGHLVVPSPAHGRVIKQCYFDIANAGLTAELWSARLLQPVQADFLCCLIPHWFFERRRKLDMNM